MFTWIRKTFRFWDVSPENPILNMLWDKLLWEGIQRGWKSWKTGHFQKKGRKKLEKCMVLDSERQEKLDFFSETNKLNVCNYHYYSLLVPSDNEWQLNLYLLLRCIFYSFLSLNNFKFIMWTRKSCCSTKALSVSRILTL